MRKKPFNLLLLLAFSGYGNATSVTCFNDLSNIVIEERVESLYEEEMQRYHVHIDVPLTVKGYDLSTIYVDHSGGENDENYKYFLGAPLRWVANEGSAYTKLVIGDHGVSTHIHLEYGVCGPKHGFQINVKNTPNKQSQ